MGGWGKGCLQEDVRPTIFFKPKGTQRVPGVRSRRGPWLDPHCSKRASALGAEAALGRWECIPVDRQRLTFETAFLVG